MSRLPYYLYKIYRFIYLLKVPAMPGILMFLNRIIFGAYIPPSCIIGSNARFSYGGSGVVIHARAKIGKYCTIGPCTTIGGRSKQYDVPRVGNNVYIGGGAKVLGDIVVGDSVVIGANSVVIKDVESNSIVAGVPAKVIKRGINPKDFV